MLGKLIKHEYKQTGKMMLPLFGAVLVLTGLTKISMILADITTARIPLQTSPHNVFSFITDLLAGITVFAFVAMMAAVVILSVMRFYKNMLGDEGYLMFTLPVTAEEHVFAKLLAAFTWTVAGIAICVGAMWLFIGSEVPMDVVSFLTVSKQAAAQYGIGVYLMPLLPMLALVAGVFVTYLQFYTAISIGGQWQQNRLVASVVAYVGINLALQIIGVAVLSVFGMAVSSNDATVAATNNIFFENPVLMFNTIFGGIFLVLSVLGVVYFFVTRWLLSKKLNLA